MTLSFANITGVKLCNGKEIYGKSHFKMDIKTVGWDVAESTGKTIIE
jgi:hypothetical protein